MRKYMMIGCVVALLVGLSSIGLAARRWVCGPSGCNLVETSSVPTTRVLGRNLVPQSTPVVLSNNALEYIVTNTVVEESLVAVNNDVCKCEDCKCEDCKCAVSPVVNQKETVVTQTYQTVVVQDNYARARVLPRVADRARGVGSRVVNVLGRLRFWR